jgi:uncharacterized protein YpuA (DUF1002 family)
VEKDISVLRHLVRWKTQKKRWNESKNNDRNEESTMKRVKKWMAFALALALLLPAMNVKADTVEVKPYISLGADLTSEQKNTVLSLLEVSEDDLDDYEVIQVTNEDEHDYLDDYLESSVIGTKALSSVKIEKVDEGTGISVVTKNITYCTSGMYTNALITAGISDAKVTVAGPFNLSGTAALVGAMKAYSTMTGEELSEESEDAATNELVLTGELGQDIGTDEAEELVALAKQKVLDGDLQSTEDIQEAIEEAADELDVTLTDEQSQKLAELLDKINDLDLDVDKIKQQAGDVYDKLKELDIDVDDAKSILSKVVSFFSSFAEKLSDWFDSLFG